MKKIHMQYLIVSAEQPEKGSQMEKHLGASVSCWVKDQTRKNAFYVAKGMIEDQGWSVLTLDEQYSVDASTYQNKVDGKNYYEQALEDEEVFVFLPLKRRIPRMIRGKGEKGTGIFSLDLSLPFLLTLNLFRSDRLCKLCSATAF